ncbi:hypothetical protein AVEN_56447-1 [Araneus ventricosus]|uniref:Secreted protein n=1 Tax=Araneus ventricosus TaxID=182803 RepID=A0A4Y2NJB1_ARAVE|nr:hypothetical protein AVEN_56447-1 [Araneus ventricosus]
MLPFFLLLPLPLPFSRIFFTPQRSQRGAERRTPDPPSAHMLLVRLQGRATPNPKGHPLTGGKKDFRWHRFRSCRTDFVPVVGQKVWNVLG